ncbi:MAG TPA: hypothetical protein PKV69_06565 [Candidatus Hydrogenedentes bacterium]|nr:hypothetical protein [Candidatus Hydrogenedentota bacterium]
MSPTSRPVGTQSVLLTSFCHERAAAPFLESLASAGVRAWTEGGENEAPVGVCVAPSDVPAAAEVLRRHVEARVAELEAFDGTALGGVDADWSETPWHEVTSFSEEGEANVFAGVLASHDVPFRLSRRDMLPCAYGHGYAMDRIVRVAVPEPFLAWAVAWVEAGQQRSDLEELGIEPDADLESYYDAVEAGTVCPECGGKDIEPLPPAPAKAKDFLGFLLGLVKDIVLLAVAREIPDDGDKAHVCRDCGCEW